MNRPADRRAWTTLLLLAVAAAPASGAGFHIFEQGTRAMGMAGAFTAQADDGSALFHNVGGLAFFTDRHLSAGATYLRSSGGEFMGGEPFPGVGVRAELEDVQEVVPHVYWIRPLTDLWKFGLAVHSPFGLETRWPDDYAGRFLVTRAALASVDVSPTIALQVTERLGVGAGLVARFSEVELERSLGAINPFTLAAAEVGRSRLESDVASGFGWQLGLLHRPTERWSWGFSYRSRLEVHYEGDASFRQVLTGSAPFDDLIARSIPFATGSAISTDVKFPDTASLGVAYRPNDRWLVEVDANWAGWNSFSDIVVGFADERLDDLVLEQRWEESNNYRLGVRRSSGGKEWRAGYVFDENPIPDERLGPLLPDADRNGYTLGWGPAPGTGGFDFALMYVPFDERTTTVSAENFNGTYNNEVWLFGVTWTR